MREKKDRERDKVRGEEEMDRREGRRTGEIEKMAGRKQ